MANDTIKGIDMGKDDKLQCSFCSDFEGTVLLAIIPRTRDAGNTYCHATDSKGLAVLN